MTSFSGGGINSTFSTELSFTIPSNRNIMVFAAAVYSSINSSYFICKASYCFAVGTSFRTEL
jgi:hypothetical protein